MDDALEKRVRALERAVTDGEHDFGALAAEADARERLEAAEDRLEDLEDRVAELEAATQALRGYVGNVRAVNRDVEERADAALAKAESLEATLDGDFSHSPHRSRTTVGSDLAGPAVDADACEESEDSDPLVPETRETGTLQRIREML